MTDGALTPNARQNPWTDLSDTQKRILLALLQHGTLSRPQLMERVGISPGSVTRLTTPLLDAGLLVASTEAVAHTGRPQSPLSICSELETVIGITLSVNRLSIVATDLRLNLRTHETLRLEQHTPAAVVEAIGEAVRRVSAEVVSQGLPAPSCLGITLGGSSSDGRIVDEATFFGWHDVPLAQMVESEVGIPCTLGNDLTGLSLAEAYFGTGIEHARFTLVTVGSGIGYGLVHDGEIVSDRSTALGMAGEIPVPDGAHPATAVAAMDCLTSVAIARQWEKQTWGSHTAHEVVDFAKEGNPVAVSILESFARKLGRFIGMASVFTTPEVTVVAGERADAAALFEEQVMVGIASVRRSGSVPLPLIIREHRRSDWARGAATLALRERILHS